MKWLIWFIIISVNIMLGVSAAIMWIRCCPVARLWIFDMEGTCWPSYVVKDYQTFATVYSGALDIVLSLLPRRIVWNDAIYKKEKIGALIAMSFGVL
ncbi:uncharacterized protein THITE_2046138 [Thermothielavioides terrestris NRRL 8126]|uniref:Rhodopsin domain-containing protein n=1 Tax=Thermothielavioides terrestris (strain ATCC 38088 / NRRL 8126) TaxID=578455 RepID=G2R284_THETT|nr:uncharacterized protein THITE_2046138 [Thermothielavioides terrestris NRRL 8126]AEO64952.1 hypothetical protein THITE_2046138 [Thermothielavioides terrestris NRRL 8126]